MRLKIRVSNSYKTLNSLEEAARVMGGQLMEAYFDQSPELTGRRGMMLHATIDIPNDVIISADRDGDTWNPVPKREALARTEDDVEEEGA